MRIQTVKGREIRTLDDWSMIYDKNGEKPKWQPGRSAHAVADFILRKNGAAHVQRRIEECLRQTVSFELMVPEREQRFDAYGQGRMHDLGITGRTESGQSLFVGVEAKVDESFGATIGEAHRKARTVKDKNPRSNAQRRIDELLMLHFPESDESVLDLRYQLLYATTGTLAAGMDVAVLYVAVFKTESYNDAIGARNLKDYLCFIDRVGGKALPVSDKSAIAHEMWLAEKRLVSVHEDFLI